MEHITADVRRVGANVLDVDVFVRSAILDDIRKEAKDTKACPCDDYDVCAYENSD